MITESRIREALHDLAANPQPEGLADRALRGAARRRLARIGGAGAAAVMTALSAVAAVQIARAPAAQPAADPAACVQYPPVSPGVTLPRHEWPDFAEAAVAALPPGPEYGVYAASGWCGPNGTDAWAIIAVGDVAAGYNLKIMRFGTASGCAAEHTSGLLLFCHEATAHTPQVRAWLDGPGDPVVHAYYPDGTLIFVRAYGQVGTGIPMADAEQLAEVAADPDLYATVPGN